MVNWALVLLDLDNLVLNNYWRKYYTYLELGWDENSIKNYLSNKKNMLQIASFNTPTVSFSASSRRNRFYAVYDRLDMLDKDVPWEGSIEALKKISEMYEIYIISSRNEVMQEKTLEVMERLGYPMDKLTLFFKKPNEKLYNYRMQTFKKIKEKYPTGVGVCLLPSDKMIIERYGYTPIAFLSIKDPQDFTDKINIMCYTWDQLVVSLGVKKE